MQSDFLPTMPLSLELAEIAITSQDIILIEGGNFTANGSVYIHAITPEGQIRFARTNITTQNYVQL